MRGVVDPAVDAGPVGDELVDVAGTPSVACWAGQQCAGSGVWTMSSAHGGACGSAPPPSPAPPPRCPGSWRRPAPRPPTPVGRRLPVVSTDERELGVRKETPSGWGDRTTTALVRECAGRSAHTDAQPRARSPTRQDASRSARVRCRPLRNLGGHAQESQRLVGALDCALPTADQRRQGFIGRPGVAAGVKSANCARATATATSVFRPIWLSPISGRTSVS